MSTIILQNNGVQNTGLDEVALNRVASNGVDGRFSGLGKECLVTIPSPLNYTVLPGDLLVSGVRVRILSEIALQDTFYNPGWRYIVVSILKDSVSDQFTCSFRVEHDTSAIVKQNLFSPEGARYEQVLAKALIKEDLSVDSFEMTMPLLGQQPLTAPSVNSFSVQNTERFYKELENLRSMLTGSVFETKTAECIDYSMQLADAAPNVDLNKVGGYSIFKDGNLIGDHPSKIQIFSENLLSYPYLSLDGSDFNGISVRDNGDGSLTLNGKPHTSEGSFIHLHSSNIDGLSTPFLLTPGLYHLSLFNSDSRVQILMHTEQGGEDLSGSITITEKDEFYKTGYPVFLYIPEATTLENCVVYPCLTAGDAPPVSFTPYSVQEISLDFLQAAPAFGHGFPDSDLVNYFDFATGEYVQRVDVREYLSGDEQNERLLTDHRRTVYPLEFERTTKYPSYPEGLINVPRNGRIAVLTVNRKKAFFEITYDKRIGEEL